MAQSALIPRNTGAPASGFFGGFAEGLQQAGEGFGRGLSRIGSDVLPVWVASQLGLQSRDQLAARGVTFLDVRPRLETGGGARRVGDAPFSDLFSLTVGDVEISGGAVLLGIGAVALVAIAATR